MCLFLILLQSPVEKYHNSHLSSINVPHLEHIKKCLWCFPNFIWLKFDLGGN